MYVCVSVRFHAINALTRKCYIFPPCCIFTLCCMSFLSFFSWHGVCVRAFVCVSGALCMCPSTSAPACLFAQGEGITMPTTPIGTMKVKIIHYTSSVTLAITLGIVLLYFLSRGSFYAFHQRTRQCTEQETERVTCSKVTHARTKPWLRLPHKKSAFKLSGNEVVNSDLNFFHKASTNLESANVFYDKFISGYNREKTSAILVALCCQLLLIFSPCIILRMWF